MVRDGSKTSSSSKDQCMAAYAFITLLECSSTPRLNMTTQAENAGDSCPTLSGTKMT